MRFSAADLFTWCEEQGVNPSDITLEPSYIRFKLWSRINGINRITIGRANYTLFTYDDDDDFNRYVYEKDRPNTKIQSND